MNFYFTLSRLSKVDMTNIIVESTATFASNETRSLGETVSTPNIFVCFIFEFILLEDDDTNHSSISKHPSISKPPSKINFLRSFVA